MKCLTPSGHHTCLEVAVLFTSFIRQTLHSTSNMNIQCFSLLVENWITWDCWFTLNKFTQTLGGFEAGSSCSFAVKINRTCHPGA